MGNFRQFLAELCACYIYLFSSQDNILSKPHWIFIKLDVCIAIVEIWFGICNEQISLICDRVICPRHDNDGVL